VFRSYAAAGGRTQAAAIHAALSGDNTAIALGVTGKGSAPILDLCRRLIAAGHDPTAPLEAYRGATLALRVRSIGEAARLRVRGDGHGFEAECRPTAPPMRESGPAWPLTGLSP